VRAAAPAGLGGFAVDDVAPVAARDGEVSSFVGERRPLLYLPAVLAEDPA